MNPELDNRIARIHAAIGIVIQSDISKFGIAVQDLPGRVRVSFGGGMSEAELENAVNQAVSLIAHLPDHLLGWAKANQHPRLLIDQLLTDSISIKLLRDLADREKHGGRSRDGGFSKKQPSIANISRGMRMRDQLAPVRMSLSFNAATPAIGMDPGSSQVVVDADVIDSEGTSLGRLTELLEIAMTEFELLFEKLKQLPAKA